MKRFKILFAISMIFICATFVLSACNSNSSSVPKTKAIDGFIAAFDNLNVDKVTLYTYSFTQKVDSDVVYSQTVMAKIDRKSQVKAVKEFEERSLNTPFNPEAQYNVVTQTAYYADGKEGTLTEDALTWTAKSLTEFLNIKETFVFNIKTTYFSEYQMTKSNSKLNAKIKDSSILAFSGITDADVKNMSITVTVDSNKYGTSSANKQEFMVAPNLTSVVLAYQIGGSIFSLSIEYGYSAQSVTIPS